MTFTGPQTFKVNMHRSHQIQSKVCMPLFVIHFMPQLAPANFILFGRFSASFFLEKIGRKLQLQNVTSSNLPQMTMLGPFMMAVSIELNFLAGYVMHRIQANVHIRKQNRVIPVLFFNSPSSFKIMCRNIPHLLGKGGLLTLQFIEIPLLKPKSPSTYFEGGGGISPTAAETQCQHCYRLWY